MDETPPDLPEQEAEPSSFNAGRVVMLDVDKLLPKLPANHQKFIEDRLRGQFIGARKISPDEYAN